MLGPIVTGLIDQSVDDDLSEAVDLGMEAEYLQIQIPTLDSCQIGLQVCNTPDGTYAVLGASALTDTTTGGYTDIFTLGGFRYIKITSSVGQSADETFTMRGWSP